jgi:hypothetical protein
VPCGTKFSNGGSVHAIKFLAITVFTLFAVPVFAAGNLFEQRTSMENQVDAWAAQKVRMAKSLSIEEAQAQLASRSNSSNRDEIALKKTLNLLPYIFVN